MPTHVQTIGASQSIDKGIFPAHRRVCYVKRLGVRAESRLPGFRLTQIYPEARAICHVSVSRAADKSLEG